MNRRIARHILIEVLALSSAMLMSTQTAAQTPAMALGRMPTIQAESLAERALTLPQDLPGERTLVLIAFERFQQKNIDTWIDGMQLKSSTMSWIETPIIDPQNMFVRAMINGGMRRGIPDPIAREKTITLFTNRIEFSKAMGFSAWEKPGTMVYAAVVDRAGRVLALSEGDYAVEKAKVILDAMNP
jgi:hypothetical protein